MLIARVNKAGGLKLYNLFGRFSFLVLLSVAFTFLNAESFSEFKKSQSDFIVKYLHEEDKLFNQYILSNWEEYSSVTATPFYTKAKPSKIPSARKLELKDKGPLILLASLNTSVNQEKIQKKANEKKEIEFDFFGENIGFNIPDGLLDAKFYPLSKKGISNFFNVAVSTEYEALIDEINKYSLAHNLNDWGKYLLIKKISYYIFSNQDEARLLRWFIFNKLGYAVKAALSKKHIIVMYASKKTIYATPMYTLDKKNFYSISEYAKATNQKLFTYKQKYSEATKSIDLSLTSLPILGENLHTKHLVFKQNMKKYTIKYRYNKNMIDFMASYPQADYETYFNAQMDSQSYGDIVNGLRKYINGKKSSTAINFVLHFVQNAFKYQVDNEQFGREKVMFADETLYYDKSDCEDRAILFAKLVKDMFKIGVVGVKYSNHMSTALYIPLKGDTVRVHSKKYVIADPTYINASIGQGMSQYKSKRPKEFIFLQK
ncbi:MAG: hypothetical protein Q9M32_06905 [Sulfurimonas sp.]|nr:hypothetical protein [Sulfurimonas sp.]MDQ7061121.1 hypothetical protein [Sulfurimonas sp.]